MHEVSLLESTLELALSYAQQQNATKIHLIALRVGQLSGVITEALQFAFDLVIQGTIAETATLSIEIIPAICDCSTCQQDFQPIVIPTLSPFIRGFWRRTIASPIEIAKKVAIEVF
jgi:hydrogenase nickel incorporation protein HypA/HybF